MREDIDSVHETIEDQAREHIHANDVILTYGRSNILNSFFKQAVNEIYFEVLICETAPSYLGH